MTTTPVFVLTVITAGGDPETATFTDRAAAVDAAIAAVDPYDTGEYNRASDERGGAFTTTAQHEEEGEDHAEARIEERAI